MLKVNEQAPEVAAAAAQWPVIDALLAGTPAMRAAGEQLMPKWPAETRESHQTRVDTATLFPAFKRTVNVMASKPFSKSPTIGDDVPEDVRALLDDVDLEGRNLQAFAAPMMREVMSYGYCGVLVEFPRSAAKTQAEEQAAGARPYWVWIKHDQLLGWRMESQNGKRQLVMLRVAETAEKKDGDYGTETVERVRVLTPGAWEIWEKGADGFAKVEEGATSLDFIPYVPFVADREATMIGAPPLLDLAYLNVKHWQSQSDQDTILHVARVPILFAKGFDDQSQIVVGGSGAVRTENKDADMKFVEHTGAAIKAGKESLADLEQQMIQTGAELLVAQPGSRTATEDANDAEANKCELQRIAESFEDSLNLALYYTARWKKQEAGGHVSLYKDFVANSLSDASSEVLIKMQAQGVITKKTLILEQQRRGTLSPTIDADDELEAVELEGPAPGKPDPGNE